MEIIAIPSHRKGGLNEKIHPKFGRCDCFTFITLDGNEIKQVSVIENSAAEEQSGRGKQAAQIIKSYGAEKLIARELGPNASVSINSLEIKVYQGPNEDMTLKEVIKLYVNGELKLVGSEDLTKGVLN